MMVALFASLTFSACSNDDDDNSSSDGSIVGTWYLYDDDEYIPEGAVTYTFKSNGTWTSYEKWEDGETASLTGKYTVKGNILTFIMDGQTVSFRYEIKDNGNILYIYYSEDEEGDDVMKFRRA